MIRIAIVSFWHVHANDYARQALAHPDTELVAAWDELPERGRKAAEQSGLRYYDQLDEMLAQPDIDAVIISTPTNKHHDVMIAAAQAGKHIFTEKVLALTLRECTAILTAVQKNGVKLTVSLPRLYAGYTQAIKEILNQQLLGTITLARARLSHSGALPEPGNPDGWLPQHFFNKELCGGGALIDLGCHPMYLTRLFLGMPESMSANFGYITGREVEDNALAVLRYPQGAIGSVEAGFVNHYSPFTIEIHGTDGSLFFGTPEAILQIRSSRLEDGGKQWNIQAPLPSDQPLAFEQWVTHIQQDTIATENIQAALDLTMLMEAATLSASSNRPIRLESLTR